MDEDDADDPDDGLDDGLDEVQRILWHGYAPVYHRAPEILPLYEGYAIRRPRRRPPAPPNPRVVRTVRDYTEFRCDHCRVLYRSPVDDADAEDEYWHTFGVHAPLAERLTLCEGCWDQAMAKLLAEPGARN
jgi:hypothetical protein